MTFGRDSCNCCERLIAAIGTGGGGGGGTTGPQIEGLSTTPLCDNTTGAIVGYAAIQVAETAGATPTVRYFGPDFAPRVDPPANSGPCVAKEAVAVQVQARQRLLTAGANATFDVSTITNKIRSVSALISPNDGTVVITTPDGAITYDTNLMVALNTGGSMTHSWGVDEKEDRGIVAPLTIVVSGQARTIINWTQEA